MPYRWSNPDPDTSELRLWPHRSLPRRGFVVFIALTVILIAIPLLSLLGSPLLWVMFPFLVVAIAGMWWALQRSYRDGALHEILTLTDDIARLTRHDPRKPPQSWQANPYWVQVKIHPDSGPVENYLTLKGNDREVEIGAFLSSEERQVLLDELRREFNQRGA